MAGPPKSRASVAYASRNMLERITSLLFNAAHTYIVSYEDFPWPAQDFMPILCRKKDVDHIVDGVSKFTKAMLDIPRVQAVAFLAARQPSCPTILSIQVVMQLQPEDEVSDAALGSVMEADGALAEHISEILPGELQFIDSTGTELSVLERNLRKQWAGDPDLSLLGFVILKRD